VHDLPLNRLLPHPDLHVFRIDQVALVLLSRHWDVNGRLPRTLILVIELDHMKLPCHNLHPSNRHHCYSIHMVAYPWHSHLGAQLMRRGTVPS
jgi:hypothetical protein